MDEARFDRVARLLARFVDRRTLAMTGAAIAAGGALGSGDAKKKRQGCLGEGRRCGKGSGKRGASCARCCSGFALYTATPQNPVHTRRCACRPNRTRCTGDAQCCQGVCNAASGLCDDGLPGSIPITCTAVFNFCQSGAQNCGGSSDCICILTSQQESFCTTGKFICSPSYANVTCQDDNDCYNDFGETYACVSMDGCAANTPCSGSGGTACAQICGS